MPAAPMRLSALGALLGGAFLFWTFLNSYGILPEWTYARAIQLSPDSRPFDVIFKPERILLAAAMLVLLRKWLRWREPSSPLRERLKVLSLCTLGATLTLIGPALITGFVRFDPKIPEVTVFWALNNLFFICLSEEVFFRGFLLETLRRWATRADFSKIIPIGIASVLFGLHHPKFSAIFFVLATIAGIFYGIAYLRGGLITATLTHFAINALHFIFFSYPALKR